MTKLETLRQTMAVASVALSPIQYRKWLQGEINTQVNLIIDNEDENKVELALEAKRILVKALLELPF